MSRLRNPGHILAAAVLLATGLAIPAAAAAGVNTAQGCVIRPAAASGTTFIDGTDENPAAAAAAEHDFRQRIAAHPTPASRAASAVIQLFVHVIAQDNTPQGGNIPDGLIQHQVAVLNHDFARVPTGLTFVLVGIDRTINKDWATNTADGNQQEHQMKTSLRRGTAATLNLYTVTHIAGAPPGYLLDGFATFPWDYNARPWKDGVVLATHALPGGPYPARGLGRTAAHEVGHWVGLYHTFQGGCTPPGDYVDDTPFEASPASGCPVGRDTCAQPGLDPIHNYMDYSSDACRNQFTPGQINRLRQAMAQFRGVPA